jgi:glycolate oxidase FAD binding subunit
VDLFAAEQEVAARVVAARLVDPVGGGTHREVGGAAPVGAELVRAPRGVVSYDPADLTVCAGAGTTVAELDGVLAEAGQECPLDPRDRAATVGGLLATGLSGIRRLRVGPIRDQLLEVRFVTGDGRIVRGGGPTVKNVTGYDLPRMIVGSLGTLGVMTRVILRCRPRPARAWWGETEDAPGSVASRCARASAMLWNGTITRVLLEGNPDDVAVLARDAGLRECDAPVLPDGAHRGRMSVPPASLSMVASSLGELSGTRWLAELGVGTVHVATDDEDELGEARAASHRGGGWMLREAGAPHLEGFGIELPNAALMERVRRAFDPHGKLAPGRIPIPRAERELEAFG